MGEGKLLHKSVNELTFNGNSLPAAVNDNYKINNKNKTVSIVKSVVLVVTTSLVTISAVLLVLLGRDIYVHVLELLWLLKLYRISSICWILAMASCFCRFWNQQASSKPVYLMDFSCYKPDAELKCNYEVLEFITRRNAHKFTLPSMDFQRKIYVRSGLGQETYLPQGLLFGDSDPSYADARCEAEQVLFGSVDDVLFKTNVNPKDISILVTNCSLHCPTPSYGDMIVNHYKLREDCKVHHLAGMGCSASLIACKLAHDLLQTAPNQYALVVSTENITLNWYFGNEKPMLVTNCLFRLGCAAMLFSNKSSDRDQSKYEFLHCIRTHKAADDKAYGCAYQKEDETGLAGVALNKNLMGVAADALRTNIRSLGPHILPFSEQVRFIINLILREVVKFSIKPFIPDFKLAVEHFCIHAGGRAVIDELQKNLQLSDYHLEPARCTLHRWGNTSASCLWYVLAYMEAKERVKAGDKVWMLGLGSGFKCNSAIWKAISDIPACKSNAWSDCIQRYPGCQKFF